LGALRRPQHWETPKLAPREAVSTKPYVGRPYPRWLVVSGVLLYCAVFWALAIAAGSWGVELIRTAMAQH